MLGCFHFVHPKLKAKPADELCKNCDLINFSYKNNYGSYWKVMILWQKPQFRHPQNRHCLNSQFKASGKSAWIQ